MRQQKLEQEPESAPEPTSNGDGNKKKRKASDGEDTIRKRTKAANGLPEGFFDPGTEPEASPVLPSPTNEIQIPSRPATPSKRLDEIPKRADVDEDEWAAFEADIAAAELPLKNYDDGVISAPAMSAAELEAASKDEDNKRRRERQEAELEGDKEDSARKLEDEFDEMESLEQRVKRLRDKREALRMKEVGVGVAVSELPAVDIMAEDDEDEEEDDDDWDSFRMKG